MANVVSSLLRANPTGITHVVFSTTPKEEEIVTFATVFVNTIMHVSMVLERVDETTYPLNIRSVLLTAAGSPPGLLLEAPIFLGCLSAPMYIFNSDDTEYKD